jgi:hypothetical protein
VRKSLVLPEDKGIDVVLPFDELMSNEPEQLKHKFIEPIIFITASRCKLFNCTPLTPSFLTLSEIIENLLVFGGSLVDTFFAKIFSSVDECRFNIF